MRTTDFFVDTSDDDTGRVPVPIGDDQDVELLERKGSASKKKRSALSTPGSASRCEPKRVSLPPEEGYQRLANPAIGEISHFTTTPSTSFHGSVEELLLGQGGLTPPHHPRQAHLSSGRTPRSSAQIDRWDEESRPSKVEQISGAHAIAHEITLQALIRDEEALDRGLGLKSFAPLNTDYRGSLLPPSLRVHDPRSPRNQMFSTPGSAGSKKVHVVPPPIDTTGPRRSLPADLVRTPYPYTPQQVRRKDFGSPHSATMSIPPASESMLTLSIRRANPHSKPRVTSLIIPATNDYSVIRSRGDSEKSRASKASEYDDAELFRQLRKSYGELTGALRLFSARSLTRIVVSGPASRAADAGYGWLSKPRSPRMLVSRGLSDTFSEEKILQHYRKPALGRSRFAFVHWAHRLAAAPPLRTPQGEDDVQSTVERDLVRRMEQPEGLEFIMSWSVRRMGLALATVVLVSVAGTLLWIFLGRNTVAAYTPTGGYRDAGDRITSGVLVGICMLLVGLSSVVGWLGVSWLVV
ncbi:hypothetical protein LTR78_009464 [Recurvomyces mirabilis]|uniref:Uncharacterized protein n=1 Tax=Recurvomyces mirabilis TaxID=574656 RepID=A0AAE0WGI6_9PEZI|nr:hypothetical protein LTR78_009464 [Recurvomyces mirabilis]KAK5152369.1 hypothetical protein LTS14_008316 [Recurvomyces mirabilis]